MKLNKTLQIGKATIKITMDYSYNISDLDGHVRKTKEIVKLVNVELLANNKLIETSIEGFIYLADGKARFGNINITESTGKQIIETIEAMHTELSAAFNTTTISKELNMVQETAKEIEIAKKIMAEVEIRKTEILSAADEKQWRINYNNINNEGGEGYIPRRVTSEDVEMAKATLEGGLQNV